MRKTITKDGKFIGHKIAVEGKTYSSIKKAAKAYGLNNRTVWLRLKKGRTIKEAFGLKDFHYSSKPKKINIEGKEFKSLRDACRHYDVDKYVLNTRINRYGWTIEQALGVHPRPGYEKGVAGIIYLIKNKISKKLYVGITMGFLDDRWEQHIDNAFSLKKLDPRGLHAAIKKDDPSQFEIKKIDTAKSEGELSEKEAKWIKFYKSLKPKGYNLNAGGSGTRTTGIKVIVENKSFKSITAACRHYGFKKDAERREVTRRINILGWTPEEALNLVPKKNYKYKPKRKITLDGHEFATLTDAANFYGLKPKTIQGRIDVYGWTLEEAFGLKKRKNFSNWNKIVFRGKTYDSEAELARAFNVKPRTYITRKSKGLPISKRLGDKNSHLKITFKGKTYTSETALCRDFNIGRSKYNHKKRKGLSISSRLGLT